MVLSQPSDAPASLIASATIAMHENGEGHVPAFFEDLERDAMTFASRPIRLKAATNGSISSKKI